MDYTFSHFNLPIKIVISAQNVSEAKEILYKFNSQDRHFAASYKPPENENGNLLTKPIIIKSEDISDQKTFEPGILGFNLINTKNLPSDIAIIIYPSSDKLRIEQMIERGLVKIINIGKE